MTRSKPLAVCATIVALTCADAAPAFAYLKFGVRVGTQQITLKWNRRPIRYSVNNRAVTGVSSADAQAAFARAFTTWTAVPTSSITYEFAGFTDAQPLNEDGVSVLGFLDRPDLERVLASTSLMVDRATGELIESDIFFNASFAWSTSTAGEAGKFDLESIALHEIGHLSGLSHSALGETELRPEGGRRVLAAEAVMFPIAYAIGSVTGRKLRADDIAGISDLYPDGGFAQTTGTLSGTVTKNGQGVFGAHIVAFNPATGMLVGSFSLNAEGEFAMSGLSPGPHIVRVEPLDDAEITSFFSAASGVDLDFRVAFLDRLVIVPPGGSSGAVQLQVVPK